MLIDKSFSLEKPLFTQALLKKLMYQSTLPTISSHKPNKDSLFSLESLPSATMKSLMTLMSMSSQSEVIKDMNTSNKSDSKLEPKKEHKLKLLLKFPLLNKITKSQVSQKSNSKTRGQCVSQSVSVVKFQKLLALKNSSKLTKIHG